METDDELRWCAFCGAGEDEEHHLDCPEITGKYPLNPFQQATGMMCMRCDQPLTEYYRTVEIKPDTYECVCDDCALQAVIDEAGSS